VEVAGFCIEHCSSAGTLFIWSFFLFCPRCAARLFRVLPPLKCVARASHPSSASRWVVLLRCSFLLPPKSSFSILTHVSCVYRFLSEAPVDCGEYLVSPSSTSSISPLQRHPSSLFLWLKNRAPPVQPWARHERLSHELINPLWFSRDYQQPPYAIDISTIRYPNHSILLSKIIICLLV
jgi:hypothetical protein